MHLCQTPIMHDMYITINNMDNYNLIDSYHNTTWINADVDDQNFLLNDCSLNILSVIITMPNLNTKIYY